MDEPRDLPGFEGFSEMMQMAALHHEVFCEYVKAGFTAEQALNLVGKLITRPAAPGGEG